MLSVKRQQLSAEQLFSGKKFYLDANIIFRLAGFNNDERQYVSKMFVNKCREAHVSLLITDITVKEIFRVIDAQVKWIRSFTKGQAPIRPEALQQLGLSYKTNDFYTLFYTWCQLPGNNYRNIDSFRSYLYEQIRQVTGNLTYDITGDYAEKYPEEYEKQFESLKQYKISRHSDPKKASVDSDVLNLMHVQRKRRTSTVQNIWGVNEFFISADQQLTNWAQQQYAGIPIIVIPSVWLSIILKLTGRADDDYGAFCSFLRLPSRNDEDERIDVEILVDILSRKTTEAEVKERIITEIVQNNGMYSFETPDDYDESTEKAFDAILREASSSQQEKLAVIETELRQKQSELDGKPSEEEIREDERRRYIEDLINTTTVKRVSKYRERVEGIKVIVIIIYSILVVLYVIAAICAIYGTNELGKLVISLLPDSIDGIGLRITFFAFVLAAISAMCGVIGKAIHSCVLSDEHMRKLQDKIYKKVSQEYK